MLFQIASIIFPVFIIILLGFISGYFNFFNDRLVEKATIFCQDIGIPFLLFFNFAVIDLTSAFNFDVLFCFYTSMVVSFLLMLHLSYFFFNQPFDSSVTLAFCAMFSNGVLLGLPISELAFGEESLSINYSIIVGHAPFCYLVGITFIEVKNERKNSIILGIKKSFRAIFFNNLSIGIFLGIFFNFTGISFPAIAEELIEGVVYFIIPLALFTMGGVLNHYKISRQISIPAIIILTSLVIQPTVVYFLGTLFLNIDIKILRNAVIMAAIAPGMNAYFFASMYSCCRETVSTTILFGTGLTLFSTTIWIYFLT